MKKLVFLLIGLSFTTIVHAATITPTITTDEYTDNDDCSLREAIANANKNSAFFDECTAGERGVADQIVLQDGETYTLSLGAATEENGNTTGDLDITDDLTITASSSATIDAAGLADAGYPERILHFHSDNLTLENLTLQYGRLVVNSNATVYGSALYIENTTTSVTISNCHFTNNSITSEDEGHINGGIVFAQSTDQIQIENSSFQNNWIEADSTGTSQIYGGILYFKDFSSLLLNHVTVLNNTVESENRIYGGLVYLEDSDASPAVISQSEFSGNTVVNHGSTSYIFGGLFRLSLAPNLSLEQSLVANNTIFSDDAGYIFAALISFNATSASNELNILNSTFAGNNAYSEGGNLFGGLAVSEANSVLKIANSTFFYNSFGDSTTLNSNGGVLYLSKGTTSLKSNLFSTNTVTGSTSAKGPNCYNTTPSASLQSYGNNVIDDLSDCTFTLADATDKNEDPTLTSLADNGGPTQTLEIASLSAGHNLDTGCTDLDGNTLNVDQRGAPRSDGACDSGAYELSTFYTDADGDGYGDPATTASSYYNGTQGNDCDDANAAISPAAAELCGDAIDNNCDGAIDEGFDINVECTSGSGVCAVTGLTVCSANQLSTECNATENTDSATDELCDGLDNDCDGETDEDFNAGQTCTNGVGACEAAGIYACSSDQTDTVCNAVAGTPETEICDGLDNDCDGTTDNGFSLGESCSAGEGACLATGVTECADDGSAAVCNVAANTAAMSDELCDGIDNDCDGEIDNNIAAESCTSGTGICESAGTLTCSDGESVCSATANTSAQTTEICDDDLDNDCDGETDEDDADCTPNNSGGEPAGDDDDDATPSDNNAAGGGGCQMQTHASPNSTSLTCGALALGLLLLTRRTLAKKEDRAVG